MYSNDWEGLPMISNSNGGTNEKKFNPLPLDEFYKRIPSPYSMKNLSKKARKYYEKQREIIESFEEVEATVGQLPRTTTIVAHNGEILATLDDLMGKDLGTWRGSRVTSIASESTPLTGDGRRGRGCLAKCSYCTTRPGQTFLAKLTLTCNFFLLIAKAAAAYLSGSLSVFSSLLDSVVDLASGIVLWYAARTMQRSDKRHYPHGRTRLEPVAIIILAVIMSVASIEMIRESVTKIIDMATNNAPGPKMDNISIIIVASTIVTKLVLFFLCRCFGVTASVAALATDNRNDVLSNSMVLVFATISDRVGIDYLKYFDPSGAILVSIYIIFSWFTTGKEHVRSLTGHVASAEFHQKICFLILTHHPDIIALDTVLAVHFGQNYMVDAHVVLPPEMTLQDSHNIGEALQRKLECLPEIERAFVHLDYETEHKSSHEHKTVII